ncbi:Hpt domain-containing protein [Sinomonas sp. G460-2]|uniref:Hpt domain-containing protein n=1 Tax=Sinomonas sp. G460-2 TaxID=3393464 RepID=UPI0039F08734
MAGGSTAECPDHTVPLVDPAALGLLAEDVGPASAAAFARDFAAMWPRRRAAIDLALGCGDLDAALEAALSLRTSSVMVGATRLAGLALRLEGALRANDGAGAAQLLASVARCGDLTAAELRESAAGPGQFTA